MELTPLQAAALAAARGADSRALLHSDPRLHVLYALEFQEVILRAVYVVVGGSYDNPTAHQRYRAVALVRGFVAQAKDGFPQLSLPTLAPGINASEFIAQVLTDLAYVLEGNSNTTLVDRRIRGDRCAALAVLLHLFDSLISLSRTQVKLTPRIPTAAPRSWT